MEEGIHTGSETSADDPKDVDLTTRALTYLGEDQDIFFMNGDEQSMENLALYRRHGYHPIILGDILPEADTCETDKSKAPRYRVILKLGFGAFATVWLARDILECRYVAIKVCCGTDKPIFSRETTILRNIQQFGSAYPGFDNILTLHEAFIISGPNGFHECLVTDVVAPLQEIGIKRGWPRQDILRQIASAMALLHSQGIAHGDPHQDNFGIALPGIQEIAEDDIMDHFLGDLEVVPVIPRDHRFPRDTVPAYMTPSTPLGFFLQEQGRYPEIDSATFKLLDFGRAFPVNQPPRHLPGGAPFHIRPPEVIVHDITDGNDGCVWGQAADIWALGCAIYPAYLVKRTGFRDFYQQLGNTLRVGGPPPKEWLENLDNDRLLSSAIHEGQTLASTDQLMSEISLAAAKGWKERAGRRWVAQPEEFDDLLKRMVTTVPAARLDIKGVLNHSWLRREP